MRTLSGAYLSEAHLATDPKRPAPFITTTVKHREVVDSQLRAMLDRMEQEDARKGPLPKPKRLRQTP